MCPGTKCPFFGANDSRRMNNSSNHIVIVLKGGMRTDVGTGGHTEHVSLPLLTDLCIKCPFEAYRVVLSACKGALKRHVNHLSNVSYTPVHGIKFPQ